MKVKRGKRKRSFFANYERVLTREELDKRKAIRKEFLNWIKVDLSKMGGYKKTSVKRFEETDRILDADVEFDYEGDKDLYAANQPRFDGWTVVSLRQTRKA